MHGKVRVKVPLLLTAWSHFYTFAGKDDSAFAHVSLTYTLFSKHRQTVMGFFMSLHSTELGMIQVI